MPKSNIFSGVLAFLILFLEGGLFGLVPFFSTRVTTIHYQGYSLAQYGIIFLPIALGGIFAAWLTARRANKGIKMPFYLGIFSHLLSLFFATIVTVTMTDPFLNLIFFALASFFLGCGVGMFLPVVNLIIFSFSEEKPEVWLTVFYSGLAMGAFIVPWIATHYLLIFILFAFLIYLALLFLFDFLQIKQREYEHKPLKGLWSTILSMVCLGVFVTLIYNWTEIFLVQTKGMEQKSAVSVVHSLIFYVLVGRIFYGLVLIKLPFRLFYWLLPLLLLIVTGLLFLSGKDHIFLLYGLIGFFYGPLMPYIFGMGLKRYPAQAQVATAWQTGAFLMTYGLSAFLFGQIHALSYLFPLILLFALGIFIFNLITASSRTNSPVP